MASQDSSTTQSARPSYQFLGCASSNPKDGRKLAGIYYILNTKTNCIYIGSALDMYRRWGGHRSALRRGRHHARHLQNSWNKHGETAFKFYILMFVDNVVALRDVEQAFLNRCRPRYNSMLMASDLMDDDIREKLADAMRGEKNPFHGKKHSDETKQLMSEHHWNVSGENNPMFGVHLNGERNPMWGKKKPETSEFNRRTKGHPVVQMNVDRSVVAEFTSIREASITTKISWNNIRKCCLRKRDVAGGYRWKYAT